MKPAVTPGGGVSDRNVTHTVSKCWHACNVFGVRKYWHVCINVPLARAPMANLQGRAAGHCHSLNIFLFFPNMSQIPIATLPILSSSLLGG